MKRLFAAILFFVILVSTFSISASAAVTVTDKNGGTVDMTELFEARTFTSSKGTKINYRIFLPKDYSTQKKYPLILFLHGLGQRGSDNESQLKLGICEPFKNPDSEIYNCIVIAPQCPGDDLWVETNTMWDYYCDYNSNKVAESPSLAAVAELFVKIRDTEAVDKNRVYVTGISMGGFGTWDLLVRYPRLFTAAMPLCGGADYRKALFIKDVPIWTFHGKKDTVVPCRGTEKMVEALQAVNGNITYTPYPDGEHGIWVDVYQREDILPWLLSQKFSDRYPEQYQEYTEEDPLPEEPEEVVETTGQKKKGSSCRSAVEGIAPVILTVSAAAFALRKKKKNKKQ